MIDPPQPIEGVDHRSVFNPHYIGIAFLAGFGKAYLGDIPANAALDLSVRWSSGDTFLSCIILPM